MLLELKDISVGYDSPLVKGFSCQMQDDNIYVFLGGNGMGKTTLFKSIAGLCKLQAGELLLDGVSLRSEVAFVGTLRPDIDYLSVNDYLSFGFNNNDQNTALELLERFGILSHQLNLVKELSDGQFKKLAIIRQLLKNPKVLLLDEPSAYLDIENKEFLVSVLKDLKKSTIVLLSTHDLDFARKVGDCFYMIKNTKIEEVRL